MKFQDQREKWKKKNFVNFSFFLNRKVDLIDFA